MGSYVGIDLHRQRSVVVVLNEDGDRMWWGRIDNTAENLAREIVAAGGAEADVALEARWGWYWAADVIEGCGARLHLAHPLAIAGYANRRVKNDVRDATLLADLLRMGRLPEAWVAPPAVRELREEVRYRHKLTRLRSGLKAQVHQTLGKEGVIPATKGIWWSGGQRWLDELRLGDAYTNRIESLRDHDDATILASRNVKPSDPEEPVRRRRPPRRTDQDFSCEVCRRGVRARGPWRSEAATYRPCDSGGVPHDLAGAGVACHADGTTGPVMAAAAALRACRGPHDDGSNANNSDAGDGKRHRLDADDGHRDHPRRPRPPS